jgi:hypothetical protein
MNETSSLAIPEVRHVDLLIVLIFQVYFKLFLKKAISFIIFLGGFCQALEAKSIHSLILTFSFVRRSQDSSASIVSDYRPDDQAIKAQSRQR